MKGAINNMANCKHELHMLIGTADGIVCRGCGRLFKSTDEILQEAAGKPADAPQDAKKKPKSSRAKKQKEGA